MSSELKYLQTSELKFYEKNPKIHSAYDVELIKKSIRRNGWGDALLVDGDTMQVLSGNGRLQAAQELEIIKIPCHVVYGLTEKQKADLIIASNKLVDVSGYNDNLFELIDEFNLNAEDFDIKLPENNELQDIKIKNDVFQVVIDCDSEIEQKKEFEELTALGKKCKLLTL